MGIAVIVDADADPTLPIMLPTAGITGYSGRWLANALSGADGTAVSNLPAVVGGTTRDLKQATVGNQPTLRVSGSEKWLQFDGIDDFLAEAAAVSQWYTTVMVAKIAATGSGPLWEGSAGLFTSLGNAGLWLNANAGGQNGGVQVGAGPVSARDKWMVLAVSQNGAASVVYADGIKTTGTMGTNPGTKLQIGKNAQGQGAISVAEILTYDTPLTGAQLDTIAAALKAAHPTLIP